MNSELEHRALKDLYQFRMYGNTPTVSFDSECSASSGTVINRVTPEENCYVIPFGVYPNQPYMNSGNLAWGELHNPVIRFTASLGSTDPHFLVVCTHNRTLVRLDVGKNGLRMGKISEV